MFEKVNPSHPDKVADRIAGAIVDLAYKAEKQPKIAVEVLIGHGYCYAIIESNIRFKHSEIEPIVRRISGIQDITLRMLSLQQDEHLANNQSKEIRCGDNGIFTGAPITCEQRDLTEYAKKLYYRYPTDGKFIISSDRLILCQSYADEAFYKDEPEIAIHRQVIKNPLGDWTGGLNVDTGATNRKLGSDMGDGVTGGGLHGKDLSKADVSVNIYCHIEAQKVGFPYKLLCSIGEGNVCGIPYYKIVGTAQDYINEIGGFEKFAEWGLIR